MNNTELKQLVEAHRKAQLTILAAQDNLRHSQDTFVKKNAEGAPGYKAEALRRAHKAGFCRDFWIATEAMARIELEAIERAIIDAAYADAEADKADTLPLGQASDAKAKATTTDPFLDQNIRKFFAGVGGGAA